jgi:hypothetical protein
MFLLAKNETCDQDGDGRQWLHSMIQELAMVKKWRW